ncbi:helix-turn-helix domain-containing protein, partial [Escherichia coli]|uniref:helix-turn-helix domain-containing protein n=5 Tax=Escherichia coli TaxID=562 RepID=UPI00207B5BB9
MRRTFTAEEKASVFELWKNGTGFSEIANILGSKPGTIFTMLRDTGGIKPHERKRAVAHLTLSEREEIRAGLSAKMSIRAIATALNRSPLNRPGFPGECFICELRLPDHRFRWKHNKLFLLLPEEYGPAFPAIVDC